MSGLLKIKASLFSPVITLQSEILDGRGDITYQEIYNAKNGGMWVIIEIIKVIIQTPATTRINPQQRWRTMLQNVIHFPPAWAVTYSWWRC